MGMVPALIGCRFVRLVPDGLHSKSLNAPRLAALIKSHKTALKFTQNAINVHLKSKQTYPETQSSPAPSLSPTTHHACSPFPPHCPPRRRCTCTSLLPVLPHTPWPLERLGHWNALALGTPWHTIHGRTDLEPNWHLGAGTTAHLWLAGYGSGNRALLDYSGTNSKQTFRQDGHIAAGNRKSCAFSAVVAAPAMHQPRGPPLASGLPLRASEVRGSVVRPGGLQRHHALRLRRSSSAVSVTPRAHGVISELAFGRSTTGLARNAATS